MTKNVGQEITLDRAHHNATMHDVSRLWFEYNISKIETSGAFYRDTVPLSWQVAPLGDKTALDLVFPLIQSI